MGTLAVVNFVSLDGVMQSVLSADEDREGGFDQGGWVSPYADDTVATVMAEATVTAAGMVLGRKTYEAFARVWPFASEHEPAVAAMNRMPKYVASRSSVATTWQNTIVLGSDVAAEIARLKAETDARLVVFGSGELLLTLVANDLIDEYQLLVFPLILGSGKRLFRDGTSPRTLTLEGVSTSPSGVVIIRYTRDPTGSTPDGR